MSRRARAPQLDVGQDSFLDIVANLVGILIILVMVIGVRAKDALIASSEIEPPAEKVEELTQQLAVAQKAANSLEADVNAVHTKVQRLSQEVAFRQIERDKVLQMITAAELGLQERRAQLSDAEKQEFDLQRQALALQQQLEDLKLSVRKVENETAPTKVIEHLPTPMAQTVFGKELHFRLEGGRLTYVPMDELVEMLKAEAPQKIWKLNQAPQVTEILGPVAGFRMKYTLRQVDHSVPTRSGSVSQRRVELDHFVLLPVRDDLGTPVEQALQDGSELDTILAGQRPQQTTITVWVYPDSFQVFRPLKEYLFGRGYLTAGRPLPAGTPIGGSPDGTRSAAQ